MHRIYPYRTTFEKLDDGTTQARIEESGDTIVSTHFLGGRDWVLICRHGEPTIMDLTVSEFEHLLGRAIGEAAIAVGILGKAGL